MGKKRAVAAAVGAAALITTVVASQQGCQPQDQCQGHTHWVGAAIPDWDHFNTVDSVALPAESGSPNGSVNDTIWQTGSLDGTWYKFNGGDTDWFFPLVGPWPVPDGDPDGGPDAGTKPPNFDGKYNSIQILVSPDPQPNPNSNFASASGNIAEVATILGSRGPGDDIGFRITNATCAPYYIWVQITRLLPHAGPPLDAGTDAPIDNTADASVNAPADSPPDAPADSSTDAPALADAGAD